MISIVFLRHPLESRLRQSKAKNYYENKAVVSLGRKDDLNDGVLWRTGQSDARTITIGIQYDYSWKHT